MSVITPTITTADSHEYREQMELIASYAEGVHIDIADGEFAPTLLLEPSKVWRSENLITHLHVMYREPLKILQDIKTIDPDLVILHAESEGVKEALEALQLAGYRTGVALLSDTNESIMREKELDDLFDHILVFAGHLGYQGGEADLSQLDKVARLKALYPDCEIGWDGGVNDQTALKIADGGVSVLNVGGYLKNADIPKNAYDTLVSLIQST